MDLYWFWALIIFSVLFNNSPIFAQGAPQLTLGDSVSIYSEKAYRREGGTLFEAVGNVIIISGKETLYGEKASLNSKTGDVLLEGSVRFIGDNLTLYGSRIEMNLNSQALVIKNARLVTSEFSIVADLIQKKSDKIYFAKNAEFTTCTDCPGAWLLSGDEVHIELEEYVQIYHALAKIKGIDVLYLPYIAIPIKNKRESGLLFPKLLTRDPEGFIFGQPIYWAIDESRDATFTPTSYGRRGYGTGLEYREVIGEKKWFELSSTMLSDSIYTPGERNTDSDSSRFFRHFTEFESHFQFTNDWTQHLLITTTKDLDFLNDFVDETEESVVSNDIGAELFLDKRWERFNISFESELRRNTLITDAIDVDDDYVQSLPSLTLSMMPIMATQGDRSLFSKVTYGLESRFTTFKQLKNNPNNEFLRNANRIEVYPYMDINWVNYGALNLSSNLNFEYQEYQFFDDKDESNFSKHATVLSTEMSFTFDRIFGLAFEETYQTEEFSERDLVQLNDQNKTELDTNQSEDNSLIGKLPRFEESLARETIIVKRNSYRHSQEFKFIHHKILGDSENGNRKFSAQIREQGGWFDEMDIVKRDLDSNLSNETRMTIPKNNTFEIQWNNSLVKKTPKRYQYLVDEQYLKDQFSYTKVGFFNVSQGFLLDEEGGEFKDKLTRLFIDTQYSGDGWTMDLEDYYFHNSSDHILTFSGEKRFEKLSALSVYSLNSLNTSNLETLKVGFQFRPHEVLGFSYLEEYDFDAREKISSIYRVDYMPYNNCWFLNLGLKDRLGVQQYTLDFVFNFGNGETSDYRRNYFSFNRLR